MRTLICLNLLALAVVTCMAVEQGEPVRSSTVEFQTAIKALGDESYDRREQAYAQLLSMTEAIWPLLEPELQDQDTERVARIRTLARDFAKLLPEQEAVAGEFHRKLCDSKDLTRAEGLDGLIDLGPGGVRRLREILGAGGAAPELTLTAPLRAVKAGESVKVEAGFYNTGAQPFWVYEKSNVLSFHHSDSVNSFGLQRPYCYSSRGGRFSRSLRCGGYFNPIRRWTPILRGEGDQRMQLTCAFTKPGYINCWAAAELTCPTISPRIPCTEETIDLTLNSGLTEEQRSQKKELRIFALPDPQRQVGTERATLHARMTGAAGKLRFEVQLKSEVRGRALRLEVNQARYAWCALVRESDNQPIAWGSWVEACTEFQGEDAADLLKQATDERLLQPGETVTWKLELPLPQQAGRYRVLAGYEVECEEFNVLGYGEEAEPSRQLDTDKIVNLSEVQLSASTPAFELHIPGEVK